MMKTLAHAYKQRHRQINKGHKHMDKEHKHVRKEHKDMNKERILEQITNLSLLKHGYRIDKTSEEIMYDAKDLRNHFFEANTKIY